MNINDMSLEEVEARLAEISSEVETRSGEELTALKNEVVELQARKKELTELAERRAMAEALENGTAKQSAITIVEERKEMRTMEENKVITTESKEYRDAFYAMIAGSATVEQRAILASPISVDGNGTDDGAAVAIPKSLDEKIWDNIHTAHPILADITTVESGVVMEVTKHTAMAARVSGKKDAEAGAGAEENTFVKVTLAGKDYEKYVELTYAEAKMSQGALEDYLAQEIAAEIGEALAKDVFAQILSDATASQAVTASADLFQDVKDALAKATLGGRKVIYAPSSKYYDIVGAVKSGAPFNMGATLGVEVKCDDAATKVTILDPKSFILNVVQSTMIEADKEVKNHRVIVSGYMRGEGTLRKNKAAAYIN